jgi:hypothetical protein
MRRSLFGRQRAAYEQGLLGPGHRHVKQPPMLLHFGLGIGRDDCIDPSHLFGLGQRRQRDHLATQRIGQLHRAALPAGGIVCRIGQDHDRRLQAF